MRGKIEMNKRRAFLTGLLLVVCFACALTAFGVQKRVDNLPGSTNIGVTGDSNYSKNYYEIILGNNGDNTVNLPGGVRLSGKSDSNADDGLHILIVPLTAETEPDAYAWMLPYASKLGKDPYAYYFGFFRGNNTSLTPDGHVMIDMTAKSGYEKAKLYFLSPDGNTTQLSYTTAGGQTEYKMEKTGYYILVKESSSGGDNKPSRPDNPDKPEKPNNPDNPNKPNNPDNPSNPDNPNHPSNPDKPNHPNKPDRQNPDNSNHAGTSGGNGQNPKTGDSSRLLFWGALMLGSFGFFMVTVCRKKNFSKKM